MERGPKIAIAAGVFMIGLALALVFRHHGPPPAVPLPGATERLALRTSVDSEPSPPPPPRPVEPARPTAPAVAAAPTPQPAPAPSVPVVAPPAASPPAAAAASPPVAVQAVVVHPVAVATPPAPAPIDLSRLRRHRIVDGDTLSSLAERYLGAARRAPEIFDWNRARLGTPDLLPIGLELVIPPRDAPSGSVVAAPPASAASAASAAAPPPATAESAASPASSPTAYNPLRPATRTMVPINRSGTAP